MKLLLGSCGLSTEPIIKACEEMVGKNRNKINVAIINEAIKGEDGDHRWFVNELQHLAKNIGGNLEFIDLQSNTLKHIKNRIDIADVVYCFGGNTDYLADVFVKTSFEKILPEILEEKVWVGSSAGSCILCFKESDDIQKTIYKEKRKASHFMEIVPIIFLPHLHSFSKFDKPEVVKASKLTDKPIYAISDNSALRIEDANNPIVIGKDYIIAKNGIIN